VKKKSFIGTVLIVLGGYGVSFSQSTAAVISLDELTTLMQKPGPDIRVINFWATWCAPCIKELPQFERARVEHPEVDILLVSLDLDLDPNPEKVYKFIQRKQIKSNVVLLNERDPNSWIAKIEESWSGAIPATIILNLKTGKRKFVEHEFEEGQLDQLIKELR